MEQLIQDTIKRLFAVETEVKLTRPDPQFGDYATNVAMQLAKPLGKNPREIAEELAAKLQESGEFSEVTIAGPGFINMQISDDALMVEAEREPSKSLAGKTIVAEYSDPNPFKVLHAGHLYTTIVGDAIARLLEAAGAEVHRVNFGGDVGLHVAKSMWAIINTLSNGSGDEMNAFEGFREIGERSLNERSLWLTEQYVKGNSAYEENEAAKQEIIVMNKRVYGLHASNDHESNVAKIYWAARDWSYDYFKLFYDELGVVQFDKYYPESVTTPTGMETVQKGLKDRVYEMSDGAVVFKGEKYGLHTRVFINSEGLPTYEAKDVGLIMQKWRDYNFDKSIIITGNDIEQYMKVVQKSIEQFEPELVARSVHLTHGNLKLVGGKKMSSRKGTVLLALDVLEAARKAQAAQHDAANEAVALGAVKYAFLANRIGGDIIYDPETSVSLSGNSGPYLQYAHARACSIAAKSTVSAAKPDSLDESERELVRKLSESPELVERAAAELMPHLVCNYLYELAQEFNRFYEKSRIVGDEREAQRLYLLGLYRQTLAQGLSLLGIEAPQQM